MLNLKDRIYTECNTVGTGNIKVGGIKDGFQDWTVLSDGDEVYYCIVDDLSWEVGQGVYVAEDNEVTRDVVFSSSTGTKLVLDGNSTAFATYPADKAVILDTHGNIILPNAIIETDTLNADRVNSPVIFTSAVLVDDDIDEDGIATALNVYTKPEVDELQRVQDIEIDQNSKDIVAIEEELESVIPAFDRGIWTHDAEASDLDSAPLESCYFIKDQSGNHADTYADTKQIYFNNIDAQSPPATHTFADVKVGQNIELFEELDNSFLLANITAMNKYDDYTKFVVDVLKSEGKPSFEVGAGGDIGVETTGIDAGVRVKFFDLGGEVSLDGFMPKAGGTFTGDVKYKKDIIIEPVLPNRFVNIKNRYATKADGTSAGSESQNFGVNFDLDHGNSGYNTVKWSNREGNILSVYGGTQSNAKYDGVISSGKHLVNKNYVDKKDLHTLTSAGNTMKFVQARSLNFGEFGATSSSMGSNKNFYFYKLYTSEGATDDAKYYEATDSTMLEIWANGALVVKTALKDWEKSSYSDGDIQARISGSGPLTFSGSLNTSVSYGVVISGLKKK